MNEKAASASFELKRMKLNTYFPWLFLFTIWFIKGLEWFYGTSFASYGIYPRELFGLKGILFAPFLHGDIKHITGNSISFFVLASSLFYFYKGLGYRVFAWIYVFSNILLWIGGRPSYHIGASMLIYGMAAFLFFSGILRKYKPLLAVSLVVVFLYGSMVWHIFPFQIDDPISWEGHLFGALVGATLAVIYRHSGPQRPPWSWELEPEFEEDIFSEELEERLPSGEDQNSLDELPNITGSLESEDEPKDQ